MTTSTSAASAPTAAASSSSASAAATSSTWRRCSTPTRRTTSRPPATTSRSRATACRRARWSRASRPPVSGGNKLAVMPSDALINQINEQIAYEFAAEQQYIAIAVYYDSLTLPRLATLFFKQGLEERNHAMMLVQYLLDRDAEVTIPGIEAPRTQFADVVEPVALSLEQEKRVGEQIEGLSQTSRDEKDYL